MKDGKKRMNTDKLLKRYPNGLPEKIEQDLQPFKDLLKHKSVLSVKCLANFGKDLEQSLSRGYDIFKGVVIELSGDFELDESRDRFWFHPQLLKTRTLYKTNKADIKSRLKKEFAISDFSSSSGYYTTHYFDEIGGYKEENFAIIDTSNDKVASGSLNHWLTSKLKISDVYNEMNSVKIDGKTMQQHATAEINKIASNMGNLEKLSSVKYNVLYRSNDSYFFYNHALKPVGKKALVHVSPLMGYNLVDTDEIALASDLMASNEYLDISKFKEEQRRRAYVSCSWKGKNIINTFCLRKPIDNYKEYLGSGSVTYRMESGYFSNSNISDKLDPKIVLFLTPEATMIPEEVDVHSHVMRNIIKLPATDEILQKIVKSHWRQLFSKKYISGENLALPRDLVKEIID